jgi:hypothetical protein
VDEVLKLRGVTDEEHRSVVAHHVEVPLVGAEFEGKATGSRTVSAKPCSPATVEKRANIGVRLPISDKKLARVNQVTSSVTSKNP